MRISDWSSDVCSSDLASALSMEQSGGYYHILMREMADTVADWAREEQRDGKPLIENDGVLARLAKVYADARISEVLRSEERGVGKEGVSTCRSRWSPDH